jgi:hypothetical protein
MALLITPSLGQSGDKNSKALNRDRNKARNGYAFALSTPTSEPSLDMQKEAVIVTVSDEGHQKIADEIDKKIQDAVDVMSTTEFLNSRR